MIIKAPVTPKLLLSVIVNVRIHLERRRHQLVHRDVNPVYMESVRLVVNINNYSKLILNSLTP